MKLRAVVFLAILAVVGGGGSVGVRASLGPVSSLPPALINTCLITDNVKQLTDFYAQVLQIEPRRTGDDYVEFRTPVAVLALFSATAQQRYIPGSAVPGQNRSSILQFRVADVDREFVRLQKIVKQWVKEPTTQPWGTRSIYFRDPDGNLVDLFSPASSVK